MSHLPMDLVDDLFLRLPATTLVRCRFLSKRCISLIDSPDFVKSHLKRTLETGDHLMILLRSPDGVLHTVYLDALDKVTDVEHPLQSGGFTEVFGSCNGLIGLRNSPVDIAVFNPSTRKIHRLPVERVCFRECLLTREYVMYGFGYDSVSQDYKVLRMVQCRRSNVAKVCNYEIKVFSLKRNEWKRVNLDLEIEVIFFYFHYHLLCRCQNGVLASNSLHWVLPPNEGDVDCNTCVRFDLASEEFDILNLPQELHHYEGKMDVGVLDGCLCVMEYAEFTHVDVWVLKEYNVEGDWSKLFRVTKPESVESLEFVRPLVYSKDRSKVLLEINVGKLVWFDLVSKSFETLGIKGCDGLCSAEIVVSSLVLGCNGDPSRAREKQMMKKSNRRGDGFLSKGFKLKL